MEENVSIAEELEAVSFEGQFDTESGPFEQHFLDASDPVTRAAKFGARVLKHFRAGQPGRNLVKRSPKSLRNECLTHQSGDPEERRRTHRLESDRQLGWVSR